MSTIDKQKNLLLSFRHLVHTSNLLYLLKNNKGRADAQEGAAGDKTIIENKRKLKEIFPKTLADANDDILYMVKLSTPLWKVGSKQTLAYQEMEAIASLNAIQSTEDHVDDRILTDLIEMTFWKWYSNGHDPHWRLDNEEMRGISPRTGYSQRAKDDAESNPYRFNTTNLQNLVFYSKYTSLMEMYFPSGTKIIRTSNGRKNKIKLKNKYYELTIDIYSMGGTGLEVTLLGKELEYLLPPNLNWGVSSINIEFHCKYSNLFKWSTKTTQIKAWTEEIMEDFKN